MSDFYTMRNWEQQAAEQDVSSKFVAENSRCDQPANLNGVKNCINEVAYIKLVSNKADVEKLRKNALSPFHSIKTFEALKLKPHLLRGMYEMGYSVPSKIQEIAIPILLQDPPQNMIAQSQSGTGKTATFVSVMLSRVDTSLQYPQVVCLAPTYELAIQIGEVAAQIGQFSDGITFRYAVKGEEPRCKKVTEHVIIGTPDKVLDWANRFLELNTIRVFVMDEADFMISTKGYQDESFQIRRHLPPNCQMMLFSATYDDRTLHRITDIVPNTIIIRIKRDEEALEHIKQFYVICEHKDEKYAAAVKIYKVLNSGQAIFFCQGRKTANWLAKKMVKDGCCVALLSGSLSVQQRLAVLDRFRDGKEKILITTSVLARGIDIVDVTIAVNFDLPLDARKRADCQTYLHRIGRTGRFGNSGLAVSFVSSHEAEVNIQQIKFRFGTEIIAVKSECGEI